MEQQRRAHPRPLEDPRPLAQRLRIRKRVGVGGFAEVYSAMLDGVQVALKLLLPAHASKGGWHFKMFIREAQFLAGADHG